MTFSSTFSSAPPSSALFPSSLLPVSVPPSVCPPVFFPFPQAVTPNTMARATADASIRLMIFLFISFLHFRTVLPGFSHSPYVCCLLVLLYFFPHGFLIHFHALFLYDFLLSAPFFSPHSLHIFISCKILSKVLKFSAFSENTLKGFFHYGIMKLSR